MNKVLKFYIKHLENLLTNENYENKEKTWNKIKNNKQLLEYAIKNNTESFNSNIIVGKILKDNTLYNSDIYNNLINTIFNSSKLSRIINPTCKTETFLISIMKNDSLKLTKEQKLFLINESNNDLVEFSISDLRFLIIKNKNFSLQERKNLFNFFYTNDEHKIMILEELKYIIIKELNLHIVEEDDIEYIANLNILDIKKKYISLKGIDEIIDKIKLYKYIKSIISIEAIKDYKRVP